MPDGTVVGTTEKFTKTWRFKNIGTCSWTTSFKFVFISGDKLGASDLVSLPNNVAPNETIDISVDFIAPATPGAYKGIWSFEDNTGRQFGLGASSNGQIWIQVKVVLASTDTPTILPASTQTALPASATAPPAPTRTSPAETLAYDFASEICSAQWFNNNNQQPCPGSGSNTQNTVHLVTLPTLEDGTTLNNPAIMINPGITSGDIRGIYPEYLVQPGDHFRAIASCEENSITCSALFRISYQDASNAIKDLWAVGEFYDKKYTQIDIDISALAGQKVKFILDVTPLNIDPGNHVFWASPGVYQEPLPTATSTVAPTATQTLTNTPRPTATMLPSPTPVPAPKTETEALSTMEKIQKFFNDIFKNIFGG
jgi:hypothetical protein